MRRRPEINWSPVDGDVVVVDPRPAAARIHVLRGAAAIVWQRLDGSDIDEVITSLREEFGLDPDVAERDVLNAVEMMVTADLLEAAEITHRPTT